MGRTETYGLGLVGVAVGVIMAALAVLHPRDDALWQWVLRGGFALFILSALVLLIARKRFAMADEKKADIGNINVSMGNQNTVGHIGHIINRAPAPNPDGVFQDGREVGSAPGAEHGPSSELVEFPALFTEAGFNPAASFVWRGLTMQMEGRPPSMTGSIMGRPPQTTYRAAMCRVLA